MYTEKANPVIDYVIYNKNALVPAVPFKTS